MSDTMLPKDIHVRLRYLKEEYQDDKKSTETLPTNTIECVLETIHDIRGAQEELNLDLHGLCYIKRPTEFEDWESEQKTREILVPEMEDLLRRELEGCDETNVISVKVQQQCPDDSCSELVHIDYTASSVESILHQRYGTEADYLLAGRVRLINIWRPIKCILTSSSIAIADGRGFDMHKDVLKADPHTSMRFGRYHEGYHWYYMSEQAEEDVLLFKAYDSDQSVPSTTCLRTRFNIANPQIDTVCSKTIEIQALVFTNPVSKQATHHQQPTEVESLTSKLEALSDEVSHSEAMNRAILDLRQWETSKTTEQIRHLVSNRDHSRAETRSLSRQLDYLEDWIVNFYISCSSSPHNDTLVEQIQQFICSTPRLRERFGHNQQACQSLVQSMTLYGPDAELLLLRQQLQAQYAENERLKVQINARVEDRMNETFGAAIRTAVKHERDKDEVAIGDLRQENQRLRNALKSRARLSW